MDHVNAKKGERSYRLGTRVLENTKGNITAITCGGNNHLYIGTSNGELFSLYDRNIKLLQTLENESITSIAHDNSKELLWIGTKQGAIYQHSEQKLTLSLNNNLSDSVRSLEIDQSGILWAAINKKGIYQLINNEWKSYEENSSKFNDLFNSIGIIRKDPKEGVWLMPDSEIQSHGILHTDGHTTTIYNPPDRILKAPTGLSVDPMGNVWIGTAFDGMFRLQRTIH